MCRVILEARRSSSRLLVLLVDGRHSATLLACFGHGLHHVRVLRLHCSWIDARLLDLVDLFAVPRQLLLLLQLLVRWRLRLVGLRGELRLRYHRRIRILRGHASGSLQLLARNRPAACRPALRAFANDTRSHVLSARLRDPGW